MHLDRITSDLPADVPLVTVVMDATRESETGNQAVLTRWKDLRRTLDGQIDDTTLEALGERVRTISNAAGKHGRVLVGARGEVLLDCVLGAPPAADEAVVGLNAFALARTADEHVRYLLAAVDRSGTDVTFHISATASTAGDGGESYEGGHDELSKVNTGGWSHRRYAARAEDSWERNAEAVAGELDRLVAEHRPELLVLTGDVRARSLVAEELGHASKELLIPVEGGSRSAGAKPEAFQAHLAEILQQFRLRRRERVLDTFREVRGQDGAVVTGRDGVLDVLRRGQVAELIITESVAGPPSALRDSTLWAGDEPLQIGAHVDVVEMGASAPHEVRADLALGRAALAQGAGITVVDDAAFEQPDGIGALLRWNDAATPDEHAFALSGDPHREGRSRVGRTQDIDTPRR
ncbi:Vms1/Ankzf1 family peptidyl-tRNA hydrolase [Georgenia halophila]|uniref:Vms1/Ankzf1 family peptidyl-tRNA hydrolase n=1 Tax=Georgenia halophila TaxID=620889 RepID=A0ABP8L7D0_9MICO